jgi:hypothetical protein
MHLGFFLLSRSKELGQKVTPGSEMDTVAMGCVPGVIKRETIVVFLEDNLTRIKSSN